MKNSILSGNDIKCLNFNIFNNYLSFKIFVYLKDTFFIKFYIGISHVLAMYCIYFAITFIYWGNVIYIIVLWSNFKCWVKSSAWLKTFQMIAFEIIKKIEFYNQSAFWNQGSFIFLCLIKSVWRCSNAIFSF